MCFLGIWYRKAIIVMTQWPMLPFLRFNLSFLFYHWSQILVYSTCPTSEIVCLRWLLANMGATFLSSTPLPSDCPQYRFSWAHKTYWVWLSFCSLPSSIQQNSFIRLCRLHLQVDVYSLRLTASHFHFLQAKLSILSALVSCVWRWCLGMTTSIEPLVPQNLPNQLVQFLTMVLVFYFKNWSVWF